MLAIGYMHMNRIKYAFICDGILLSKESVIKYLIKTFVINGADFVLSSDESVIKHGAKKKIIYWHSFISISEDDVIMKFYNKKKFKEKIGCPTGK